MHQAVVGKGERKKKEQREDRDRRLLCVKVYVIKLH